MVLGWLTVEEALEKILSYVHVLEPEDRPILECLGRVLTEDVVSTIDIPPLDNTAMDGYAVRWEDIREASQSAPVTLEVVEELPAGRIARRQVARGTAIRIMTGAPLPQGADTIVPFEETDEEEQKKAGRAGGISHIRVLKAVRQGSNIRRAGEDVTKGRTILKTGTVLRPAEIGVLASLGQPTARVVRQPVVSVLATGDELVEVGEALSPGKIYNSNNFSVASLILRYGGIPRILGIARDNLESLKAKIREGMDTDMMITSAGVSKGDYDIVKDVLAQQGEISFWMVKMKPAKPLAFGLLRAEDKEGRVRQVPHMGLPGNPVSSMIAFEQFGRAALLKMQGRVNLAKPTIQAIMEDAIVNTDGRRVFARAIVTKRNGRYYARTTGPQGSGILTSMSLANGLAVVPEDVAEVKKGDIVQVQMLDWPEEWA
ncbi:MAG: gephyrin-like molybdotransferase Glp [Dehalococcoidia bacterium]